MRPETTRLSPTASDLQLAKDVGQIIADACGMDVAQIAETTLLTDLPWDSLDQVECVMELEEHFDISISDEMMGNAKDVGGVVAGIRSLLSQSPPNHESETPRS